MNINKEQLKKILPHREHMLLIDKCELTADKSCVGYYAVTGGEFFLQGHFPGRPIVPGVILCEMMAQNCHVLLPSGEYNVYLAEINNVKFRRTVVPGDIVELKSRLIRKIGKFYSFEAEAYVDGHPAASGTFVLNLTL